MRFLKNQIFITLLFFIIFSTSLFSAGTKIEPVEKSHFIYYFDSPHYIELADSLLLETRQYMIELFQDSLSYKPSVYLLSNLDEFNSLVSGHFPDWGAAAAIPQRKMIVIKSPDSFNLNKSLDQLLIHEYAHLAVAHKSPFQEPPRWFNEGVAMFVSMEWSWSNNIAMGQAAVFGKIIDLEEIEMVNRFHAGKAQTAYAESYLAIRFLLKNYGQSSLRIFLEQINSNKSVNEAIYITTGSTLIEFQNDFKISLHKQFNYASLFMYTIFFWIALAGIVVYAFFLQFKKRREYYKKWDVEEKLESKDFDYGDPDNPEQIEDDDEAWRQ